MTRITARTRHRLLRLSAVLVAVALLGAGPAGAEQLGGESVGSSGAIRSNDTADPTAGPASSSSVTVTGSGFGHGVGLSQYGAYGMAKTGASARQILAHYFPTATLTAADDQEPVLVNVVEKGRSVTFTPLTRDGGTGHRLRVGTAEGAVAVVAVGQRVVVTPEGARLRIVAAGRTLLASRATLTWSGTPALRGPATAASMEAVTSGSSSVKRRSYGFGRIALTPVSGAVRAVAVLDLHAQYLRGLAEMPALWPEAALRAQVVLARSYAMASMANGIRSSCGCHLWDDVRDQVYYGLAKEHPRWTAAVAGTQPSGRTGLVLTYGSRPIRAYYFSSSGGRTRLAQQVWGGTVPYLTSVPDPWSVDATVNPKYAVWTRAVSPATLRAAFGLPDLAAISVIRRDPAGAALMIRATSSNGQVAELSGDRFRSRAGLPSAWVTRITLPT